MGSPISGYIAEFFLQKLEASAFETQRPPFWVRYMDETFAIIKNDRQLDFKTHLNSIFTDIQFKMEEEKDGALPFLNVLVRRRNNIGLPKDDQHLPNALLQKKPSTGTQKKLR